MELFRLLCQPQRFPVALRMRHCKVGAFVFLEVATLDFCDDGNGYTVQSSDTAQNCTIISIATVTVQFKELLKNPWEIVVNSRAVFLPNQHLFFPSGSLFFTAHDACTSSVCVSCSGR